MPSAAKWWTFGEARGLNQRAQPLLGGDAGVLLECENLSFYQTGALVQRFGSASQSLTSSGFTGAIEWIGRFTTTGGVEELWGAANNAGTAALARRSGLTWAPISFSDTVNVNNLRYMQSASLTHKFFICYDSDVNRLHVWDGTTLRRVGFGIASAVTAVSMGGSGQTWNRWYRKRVAELDADGTVIRMSEPSESPVNVSIIDDAGVTITRGTVNGEGETHWIAEAADDESGEPGTFFQIATLPIATGSTDDTFADLAVFPISPLIGEYIPPPSAKYILSDTNRILLAGAWESAYTDEQTQPKQNRVWFTPVLGSTDEGDDERIPNTVDQQNWVDVGNEGPITGLAGPLYGDIYVMKSDSVFKLTPTGDFVTPYRVIQVSAGIGAVDQRTVCVGELGNGTPSIFFASPGSVYVITAGGITEISDPVSRDLRLNNFTAASSWLGYNPFNKSLMAQTNSGSAALSGQYYQFEYDLKEQRWSGISIGGGESGWILGRSILGVDTVLGGGGATIRNVVVAQNDNSSVRLLLCGQNADEESLLTAYGDICGGDATEPFTSRFRVRKFPTPGHRFMVGAPTIIYRSPTGITATGTLMLTFLDQNANLQTFSKTLTATDADNGLQQVVGMFDGAQFENMSVLDVRLTLSYSAPFTSNVQPSIDAFLIPLTEKETYAQ
jgi:hypothetical protein